MLLFYTKNEVGRILVKLRLCGTILIGEINTKKILVKQEICSIILMK